MKKKILFLVFRLILKIMKKIISLFIIFLFLFNLIPYSFAMETKSIDINSFDEFSILQFVLISPVIILNKVDLPAPFNPMIPILAP